MLQPKRRKYRKEHRGRMKGKAYRGSDIQFGEYGLKAMEPCWVTSRQLEAGRRVITRNLKRQGQVWIRVFPHKPVTQRAAESRMGSGKGEVDHYVAVVKPGRILFEVSGTDKETAVHALEQAGFKLPCRSEVVARSVEGV